MTFTPNSTGAPITLASACCFCTAASRTASALSPASGYAPPPPPTRAPRGRTPTITSGGLMPSARDASTPWASTGNTSTSRQTPTPTPSSFASVVARELTTTHGWRTSATSSTNSRSEQASVDWAVQHRESSPIAKDSSARHRRRTAVNGARRPGRPCPAGRGARRRGEWSIPRSAGPRPPRRTPMAGVPGTRARRCS